MTVHYSYEGGLYSKAVQGYYIPITTRVLFIKRKLLLSHFRFSFIKGKSTIVAMETHDTGYLKLDQEFDRCLAEMKPHVLKLPHKTGKILSCLF